MNSPSKTDRAMCLANTQQRVTNEVGRQDAKWGEQSHPNGTHREHVYQANAAREMCERLSAQPDGPPWFYILMEEVMEAGAEEDTDLLIEELIQVAAVAVNWVRDLCLKRDFPCS